MSAPQAPRKEEMKTSFVAGLDIRTVDDPLGSLGNLLGWPALSIPCGFVGKLPIGMLILAAYGREDDVLSVGIDFHRSTDWHQRRPPL